MFSACDEPISFVDPERQIQASFRFSWEDLYAPANVLSENITWAAPIRYYMYEQHKFPH
jgi:hypothetical protein